MGIIQFSIFGILLILLGLFLLIMEIFQPGFGIFGGLGIIFLLLGVFTFEAEPFLSPQIFDATTMMVLGALLSIGILFVIISREVVKDLRTKPKTGPEALIGLEAEVIKELNPIGQVMLRNEIWQAESADGKTIPEKSKVKIVKIEGNTLFVEK
ncbi:MAG: NfeD family protein [Candidatus Nealsonbacteria bacterium]|nr:NfeD family protein [Candidatus Nealsonbacteria bacterium]